MKTVSEYISRNEAYQELREARCCDMTDEWGRGYNAGITEAMDIINNIIPPADAAPAVHGRWTYTCYYEQEWYKCSNCGANSPCTTGGWAIKTNYCPNCGAKMDGEDKNNESV